MNSPERAVQPSNSPVRRIAIAAGLSVVIFALLWMTVFSAVTSALIGAGCCVVVVAASSASDVVDMLLDAIASAIAVVLAAVAAILAALFGLFGL